GRPAAGQDGTHAQPDDADAPADRRPVCGSAAGVTEVAAAAPAVVPRRGCGGVPDPDTAHAAGSATRGLAGGVPRRRREGRAGLAVRRAVWRLRRLETPRLGGTLFPDGPGLGLRRRPPGRTRRGLSGSTPARRPPPSPHRPTPPRRRPTPS